MFVEEYDYDPFDARQLDKGIYLYSLQDGESIVKTKRMIFAR